MFKDFADKGYFTINQTASCWAGVWSDMTIEQTLMRSIKSSGGLTRGRGITDSVLAKWVGGSPGATAICSSLEECAGVTFQVGSSMLISGYRGKIGMDKTGQRFMNGSMTILLFQK